MQYVPVVMDTQPDGQTLRVWIAEYTSGVHYGRNDRSVKANPVKTFMNSGNSKSDIIDARNQITSGKCHDPLTERRDNASS